MVLGTGASGLALWLILRFIHEHVGSLPRVVSAPWAIAAVVAFVLQILAVAYRWAYFSFELGCPLDYGSALSAYFVSVFLNQLLPFGMLGDALRGVWHAKRIARERRGEPAVLAVAAALVLDRASGQLALFGLVLAILPLWWRSLGGTLSELTPTRTPALALAVFTVVTLGLCLLFGRAFLRRTARVRAVFFRPRALALHLVCSLGALGLHALAFACTAHALGFALPLSRVLRVVPLVLEASALPSFAFGVGAREAAAATLYRLLGLDAGEGAAVALATGGLGFVASWPGFALWVLARRRTRVTPASG